MDERKNHLWGVKETGQKRGGGGERMRERTYCRILENANLSTEN